MRCPVFALGVVALLTCGCLAGAPAASDSTPSPTDGGTPSSVATSTTAAPAAPTTVEYHVRAGEIPEEFATATVTLRVVFVERDADLGPCYRSVYTGPYKPTITPVPPPEGTCRRTDPVTVELTELDGTRVVERAVPETASGHAVVVTGLAVARENGSSVSAIDGVGGHVALESSDAPRGAYGVELGFDSAPEDHDYDYWLLSEAFDPSG